MPVSMDKIQRQAPELVKRVTLAKAQVAKAGLDGQVARVALVLDVSASMDHLYRNGTVQDVAERVLALGTQFDDDGDIDVYTFGVGARHVGTMDIDNFRGRIGKLIGKLEYGTNYGTAVREVAEHSFRPQRSGFLGRKKTEPGRDVAVYAAFITDGDTQDQHGAREAFRFVSKDPVFFQCIGIGGDRFSFLREIDELEGRVVDNAGFFEVNDLRHINDDELYNRMLSEFPSYLRDARAAGVLA